MKIVIYVLLILTIFGCSTQKNNQRAGLQRQKYIQKQEKKERDYNIKIKTKRAEYQAKKIQEFINRPCPSLGNPYCQKNWRMIKQELNKKQVELLLGLPESISQKGYGKNHYEIWCYKSSSINIKGTITETSFGTCNFLSKARVDIKEGAVIGFSKPNSYIFINN